jgi:hypothetical protein
MRALRFPFKHMGSAVTGDVDGPMLDSVVVEAGVIVVSMFTVMPSLLSSPSCVHTSALQLSTLSTGEKEARHL